jgi:RNA polymerase sigma factor (sigma-70 family)
MREAIERPGNLQEALHHVKDARPRLEQALRFFRLSDADLDDILQVAITELALHWNKELEGMSISRLYARVLRTAHLRARDMLRREAHRLRRHEQFGSPPPEAPPDPETIVSLARECAAYVEALGRLPPALFEPLWLSATSEMTFEEIAATLGLPIGTVKTRIRRARALCARLVNAPGSMSVHRRFQSNLT